MKPARRRGTAIVLAALCWALILAGRANGQSLGGQISYTGGVGPIGSSRPLCLCIYADAQLHNSFGCLIYRSNPTPYHLSGLGAGNLYLIAFVDVHSNEEHDGDE